MLLNELDHTYVLVFWPLLVGSCSGCGSFQSVVEESNKLSSAALSWVCGNFINTDFGGVDNGDGYTFLSSPVVAVLRTNDHPLVGCFGEKSRKFTDHCVGCAVECVCNS